MSRPTEQEVNAAVADLMADPEVKALETAEEPPKAEPKAEEKREEPPKAEEKKPDEPVKKPEPRQRKAEVVPITRFHEVRHELQAEREAKKALEQELERLRQPKVDAPKQDDLDETAKRIAADKADPEVIREILRVARESQPKADNSELERRLAAIEAERSKAQEEMAYRVEEENVLGRFPELKPYAKDLKDMAYTEGNERVPLEYLALKLKHDLNLSEGAAPAEGASAPPTDKPRDLARLTEDELASLSPAELDQFIKANRVAR